MKKSILEILNMYVTFRTFQKLKMFLKNFENSKQYFFNYRSNGSMGVCGWCGRPDAGGRALTTAASDYGLASNMAFTGNSAFTATSAPLTKIDLNSSLRASVGTDAKLLS